jgi:hypothetical protein
MPLAGGCEQTVSPEDHTRADETTGRLWAFTGDGAGQRYTPSETSRLRAHELLHRCRAPVSFLPQSARRMKSEKDCANKLAPA